MPDAVSEAPTRRPMRSRFGLRALSLVIIAVFAAVAASLYVGASRLGHDQEHRLLVDRTREIGSLLQSAIGSGLQQSLISLASAAQQSPSTFARVAHGGIAATGTATVALVRHTPSGWTVDTAVGTELKAGRLLSGAQSAIVNAAGAQMKSDILTIAPHDSRLVLTLGSPSAPAGTVIY